jgi:hypothetical protein
MKSQTDQPQSGFRPGGHWPDTSGVHINAHGGGILLHEGVYYWFGEHKTEGEAGNFAHVGVHLYSSTDLYQWTDRGIALAVNDDADSEILRGCILERPKVIYNPRSEKFVMGFHLEPKGDGYAGARYGVALSDYVTGPYRYLGSARPNAGYWPVNVSENSKTQLSESELVAIQRLNLVGGPVLGYPADRIFRRDFFGGQMSRDMTLFVDDDATAYHIYSSEDNGVLHVAELSADYLSHTGRYARIFPGGFHEAPAIAKCRGRYFLFTSDCTGWNPNPARLAVADCIWGPWEDLGNPIKGSLREQETTFDSQGTFVLPIAGISNAFIFMADRWSPGNAIDGRYVWLPLEFNENGHPFLRWHDTWDLSIFQNQRNS